MPLAKHRRSTGEVLKSRALEVAKQFERVSKGKGNRHRVRNTFADFYREHFEIDLPFASVRAYCQNWLNARKAETSVATHSRYEKTIERFLESLREAAETDLNEVTKSHITAFRDSMLARYATRTANLYLKIIKMVFRRETDGYCGKIQRRESRQSRTVNRLPADRSHLMSLERSSRWRMNGKA
jgi:hypothetical protein